MEKAKGEASSKVLDTGARPRRRRRSGWLTRRQVAEVLGMDERRVAQLDGRELHPVRRIDGSWTYEPREVGAFLTSGTTSGPVTAQAFGLFLAGKTDPEVVIETLQTAKTVTELRASYDGMSGTMTLDRGAVTALERTLGKEATKDGATLAAAVDAALKTRYAEGFFEGRADVQDLGEVVNPKTGERRRLTRDEQS